MRNVYCIYEKIDSYIEKDADRVLYQIVGKEEKAKDIVNTHTHLPLFYEKEIVY